MKYIKCRSEYPTVRADVLRLLCLISSPERKDIQVSITKNNKDRNFLHEELVSQSVVIFWMYTLLKLNDL